MVYKKYIKKDGKLYGPYIYESKRVDGKVVSEYHGPKKIFDIKKYAWIFASAAFVIFLVYFLSTFNFAGLTGLAILNTGVNYTENQPIKGNLAISLKQGELLPADSKLILENLGQTYEYNLNELVSNQDVNGNFYIDGVSLSGTGLGYGIEGERTVYPPVSFVLNIYPVDENASTQPETVTNDSVIVTNEGNNESNIIINETADNSLNIPESEQIPEPAQTPEPIVTPEPSTAPEAIAPETPAPETTTIESETSPITGFFVRAFNFFISLTPTGRAISQENEISGQASFGNSFVYDLSEGAGVQLQSGSVSVSGEVIPDDNVQVKVEGNKVIVETSYSDVEKGFGQEYLGDGSETLNIDLSSLGLVLNEGDLIIKVVHENNEIVSTNVVLESGQTTSVVENVSNSTTMNVTIEQPINQTTNQTSVNIIFGQNQPQIITAETVQFILTEDEKALLAEEFGEVIVKATKSEIVNNRLVKRYEIGNNWVEYSYDPNGSEADIEYQMSVDRMKWLKDLAGRIKIKKAQVQAAQQIQPVENFSVE